VPIPARSGVCALVRAETSSVRLRTFGAVRGVLLAPLSVYVAVSDAETSRIRVVQYSNYPLLVALEFAEQMVCNDMEVLGDGQVSTVQDTTHQGPPP
jgi:hypothetical protein